MTKTYKHYHFDHVGSFLRPQTLKEARLAYSEGQLPLSDFKKIQESEIKRLVKEEVNVGLKAVTDGEFNRSWWHLDFLWGLNGVGTYEQEDSYKFHGAKTRTTNIELTGKVAFNPEHPFFADFNYLKSLLPEGVEPKVTIPSPSLIPNRDGRSDRWPEFYGSWEEFLDDLAQAYHETLLHFYELGAHYIQLDDTTWAYLIARLLDDPENHEKYVKMCEDIVYLVNKLLKDLPEDLRVSTHICRGNFKSTYLFEGSYEPVAKYLGQLNYDTFFLEYDDARSGSFAPLAEIWNQRKDVLLVLGLFTSKHPELEKYEDIKARLDEALESIPLENLALSTQCGFASTEEGNDLTEEEEWAKLAHIKKIVDKIWK
ncbi:vitamin B12 independent methionine synthase [Lactococcus lactis subsp. lactis]|uniref:vitamin B12 independent methionine synthase n=1 Tax=Lactococcus lactis TaxID=1358 RepID=UPI00071E54A7|nr:vitamin B12 independent methionine synthase [Lactococcus lactis]MDT3325516.1 vitamin B12 independent methionine synthase [Bacillota bacterium]KST78938.1 Methionine synthase II (cobalamin-independent) [Lactococcus lactis subsp. lactis]MBR8679968.1 vitamin B12 independent methionine synthase [Lactococcus lactis subsp. lactis]MBR8682248.1 vitamin B12 independent methionine synthase [Lactococcus lactis subsp. lactis]MBR8687452.1 vitamin B12 independent methionine synthase [Lactococcus lactis su